MARKTQEMSIYRIAAEAGVSVPTVSRVINRKAGVAEATRDKVNELLRHYNYRPDYPAMSAVKIAVVHPWPDLTEYFRKAMRGVYAYTQEHDLMVNIIIVQPRRRESLLEAIRAQQCSGVVALLPEHYREELAPLGETDLPTVVVDSISEDPKIGFIDHDAYSGSAEAARHLLALGHRRIGYLRRGGVSLNQLQRFKGYENTMRSAGIEVEPNWVIDALASDSGWIRGMEGLETTRRLLAQAPDLTAIMAVDDSMALGALTAIHESGRHVPRDISVVGFDNYPETQVWYPALTTVDHPLEKAGYMAVAAIHAGLKTPATWIPPREILPTSLVVRKSTGPAAEKQINHGETR